MVVGLAAVIQAASVVQSNFVTLLGVVNAVAGGQSLLLDAHCECGMLIE